MKITKCGACVADIERGFGALPVMAGVESRILAGFVVTGEGGRHARSTAGSGMGCHGEIR